MSIMKTVGLMTLKEVRKLAADIAASAPKQANIVIHESESSLVIESARGNLLSAIWVKKSQCSVRAVDGLVTKIVSCVPAK